MCGWGIRVSVRIQWILLFFVPFPGLEHHLPHLLLIGADWISSYKRAACLSSCPQNVVEPLGYHLVLFS